MYGCVLNVKNHFFQHGSLKQKLLMKKPTHGGKRNNSGRTPGSFVTTVKKEPTKVIRIPISKEQAVKDLIKS